jgi:hypothetical protein
MGMFRYIPNDGVDTVTAGGGGGPKNGEVIRQVFPALGEARTMAGAASGRATTGNRETVMPGRRFNPPPRPAWPENSPTERLNWVTHLLDADNSLAADLRIAARIVAELFTVKAAAVNLVLSETVLTLGSYGLPGPGTTAGPSPLGKFPCAQVVKAGIPLVIEGLPDWHAASAGPIEAPHAMTLYAGVPLRVQGEVIGTLCLFDNRTIRRAVAILPWLDRVGREITRMMTTGTNFEDHFYHVVAEISRDEVRFQY